MTRVACARTLVVLAATLLSVVAMPVRAQTPAVPPAEALFADASAKEVAVRKALETGEPLPTLLKAVRTVVADYEAVVSHYPSSSLSDDALWKAARLARDGFEEFHDARDRAASLRLFQQLETRYPSSGLVKQSTEHVAWLNAHPAKTGPSTAMPAAAPSPAVESPAAGTARPAPAARANTAPPPTAESAKAAVTPLRLATIKGIRRAVLKDVVRIIIELDAEVPFHDERIENPTRVFVDLPATRANPTLIDQTLRFDADTDVVRQIRVGRHPNSTTRVVLEAAGVSSYSVYPLYSPFRLVIDCLRVTPALAEDTSAALTAPPVGPAPGSRPASPGPVRVKPIDQKPADQAALISDQRPAWVASLAKPAPAPILAGRRIGALATPPATGGLAPADAAEPASTDAKSDSRGAVVAPVKPPQTAVLPPGEPSRNVAGGLSIARQLGLGVSRIVIDPGHGGHDPGAKGGGITEAELVLDVSLRLEKLLAKLPGVEVVLTRRENDFVALQERTAIANREGADLFLSIHANASSVPAARGVETYFLNFASNQSAAAVAARENATSDQTMGALQDVVKAIALNSKLDESRDFATYVQREMLESIRNTNKTVKDLGVKQAPFVVLIGASMPSVLAEISFITNPQEAKLLKSSSYRQRIAQALFDAVKEYQASLKTGTPVAAQQH